MFIASAPGVNFINIILAAFTRKDLESRKKDLQLDRLFLPFGIHVQKRYVFVER